MARELALRKLLKSSNGRKAQKGNAAIRDRKTIVKRKPKGKAPQAKSRTTVSTLQSVENLAHPQSQDGLSSEEESQTGRDCEDEDTINTSEEKSISEGAILQAAKAMRLSKAEADAQVEVICQGSSDLKKKATIAENWAALSAPNEAPEFLARLRLAYMQATAKKPLSKSEYSLAETVKQNAERLKEVKKDTQVLPCSNTRDGNALFRAVHTCFAKMRRLSLEYLIVRAQYSTNRSDQITANKTYSDIDVAKALMLSAKRENKLDGQLFKGDMAIAAQIIYSFFGVEKACKHSRERIADCRGCSEKTVEYFAELAQACLDPDPRMIDALKQTAITQLMNLQHLQPLSWKALRNTIADVFDSLDAIPHQLPSHGWSPSV